MEGTGKGMMRKLALLLLMLLLLIAQPNFR